MNTQTTAYAPLLINGTYTAGGTFYWRVAVVDTDSNVGDYTPVRSFALPPITTPGGSGGGGSTPVAQKFKVMSSGSPTRNKLKTITLTVRNASFQPVAGASVRVSGAGVRAATKQTGATGKVSFRIRATALSRQGDVPGHEGRLPGSERREDGQARLATTAISMRAPEGSAAICTVARAGYGSERWCA